MLRKFIQENCILKGGFSLSAGGESDIYFDMKRALLDSDFINALISEYRYRLCPYKDATTAIGGCGMGAALLVPLLLLGGKYEHAPLNGMIVRDPKRYGTKNIIEGRLPGQQRISVVDDVLTTGNSINIACSAFKDAGYMIKDVFVLINRANNETINSIYQKYKVPITSLFHASEFEPTKERND